MHRQAEIQSQLLADHVQGLIDTLGSIVAATVQLLSIVKIQIFLHQIEDVFVVRAFLLPMPEYSDSRIGKQNLTSTH